MTAKKTGPGRTTPKQETNGDAAAVAMTFDQIMAAKEPVRYDVRICLVPELLDPLADAKKQLREAERAADREKATAADQEALEDARARVNEAQAAVDERSATFRFRAIGGDQLDSIMRSRDHLPTAEQINLERERAKRQGRPASTVAYNENSFSPALIAASCVEPEMTEADARLLWVDPNWSHGERTELFNAAWTVNEIVPKA